MNLYEETTQSMLSPRKVLGCEREVYHLEKEEAVSREMNRILREDYSMCETLESKARKEEVLRLLNEVLLEWEVEIRTKLNLLTVDCESHIIVIPYGSYRFGVSTPSGEIPFFMYDHFLLFVFRK